jgi:hypothetical protein
MTKANNTKMSRNMRLKWSFGILIIGALVNLSDSTIVNGQQKLERVDTPPKATYEIVSPPNCLNYKDEKVRFINTTKGRPGVAAGMANKDKTGAPVVYRSNYGAAPQTFQRFIDRHECAHHQTGDVDRPHPPRNGQEHLMNESIADCIAIMRLRDEEHYDKAGFDGVAKAMRHDMEKIGFPEISVSSRISNISNCYKKYDSAESFINKVLKRRGLLQQ